ncbi:MAG: hypothetical protein KF799_05815 [Bdellovibrionales bacterium]|nr:hypothetical protein [Bdellovibrionales bacterium]
MKQAWLRMLNLSLFSYASMASALVDLPPCGAESKRDDLCWAAIADLRPTQFAAGFLQVQRKSLSMARKQAQGELDHYIFTHPVPAVIGPDGDVYIVDGHHFSLAAAAVGINNVVIEVVRNWHDVRPERFIEKMLERRWMYLSCLGDACQLPTALPRTLNELVDDPYRTLAAEVRKARGFKKAKERFSEFVWADFFRSRIPLDPNGSNMATAVIAGVSLARSKAAEELPGWDPALCELALSKN